MRVGALGDKVLSLWTLEQFLSNISFSALKGLSYFPVDPQYPSNNCFFCRVKFKYSRRSLSRILDISNFRGLELFRRFLELFNQLQAKIRSLSRTPLSRTFTISNQLFGPLNCFSLVIPNFCSNLCKIFEQKHSILKVRDVEC